MVIAKNYDKEISQLEYDLEWNIEILEEITFEEASKNWTPDGEFRLYFTEKATMIFFPHSWAVERYRSQEANSLCYAYSATAMAFYISYSDLEEEYERFIISSDGKTDSAEGQELAYEKEGLSADAIIFKLIDDLLGENFHEIEMTDKAFRCKHIKPQRIKPRLQMSHKKWWEFWK